MKQTWMMRATTGALLGLGAGAVAGQGCAGGSTECLVHCFEYVQVYVSVATCQDDTGDFHDIPFTSTGSPTGYFGKFCKAPQGANELIALGIQSVLDGDDVNDVSADAKSNWDYAAENFMAPDIFDRCMASAPSACDHEEEQFVSAEDACKVISGLAETELKNETEVFILAEPEVYTFQPGEDAENVGCLSPMFPGMDSFGVGTSGLAEDDGYWVSDDGTDGADSSGGVPADPFGDVGSLIYCNPQTDCEVAEELIYNMQANFVVFYQEGVVLDLVSSSARCGPGAKLTGLNNGEESDALADELDFRNADVIYSVNGTTLDTQARALAVVSDLMESQPTTNTLVVKRWNGSSCDTLNYSIEVI